MSATFIYETPALLRVTILPGTVGDDSEEVWEIYLMKGCSDEMQMSLSDFEFAVKLPRKKNKLEYESDLEQVVKTALLWIEEDFEFPAWRFSC